MMQGVGSEAPLQGELVQVARRDERLFRDLLERFAALAEVCTRFSREIYNQTGDPPEADLPSTIRRSLSITRRVFGEGFLEILVVLYLAKSVKVEQLRTHLGAPPVADLQKKLRTLEEAGLVQRESTIEPPGLARYTLTHKGTIIARLGEPVFLYLRMAEGWSKPVEEPRPRTRRTRG